MWKFTEVGNYVNDAIKKIRNWKSGVVIERKKYSKMSRETTEFYMGKYFGRIPFLNKRFNVLKVTSGGQDQDLFDHLATRCTIFLTFLKLLFDFSSKLHESIRSSRHTTYQRFNVLTVTFWHFVLTPYGHPVTWRNIFLPLKLFLDFLARLHMVILSHDVSML